jgi:transposase-like protein
VAERIRKLTIGKELEAVSLGELIPQAVRGAIEQAVEEELETALGARVYQRDQGRRGYRNGHRERTLSARTGPVALSVPRGTLFIESGERDWSSSLLPRY